jgi:NitT/TauT family transport system substrate-binding protein
MRRILAAAVIGSALSLPSAAPSRAEVPEVRIVAQNGSNYLPLYVMQGQKLVEKHLAAKGLSTTTVGWTRLAGPSAIIDSFLAGAVHFSGQGVPSTALVWDRTRNGIGVRAVSAMVASNIWLMTRKPELKSLRDLTDKDRIALPSIKTSAQAPVPVDSGGEGVRRGSMGQARLHDRFAAPSRCHDRRAQPGR